MSSSVTDPILRIPHHFMTLHKLLILLALLTTGEAFSQKFLIRGQVMDSTGTTLPSATVMLMNPKDSTLVNFGVSDLKGIFEIRNVNKGRYNLRISFVGYGA